MLPDFPDRGPFRGPDGTLRFWKAWTEAFSDFSAEVEGYVPVSESVTIVVARMVGRGRDSDAAVDTPSFAMVWTARGGSVIRMEMLESKEAAFDAVGLPADTPLESF